MPNNPCELVSGACWAVHFWSGAYLCIIQREGKFHFIPNKDIQYGGFLTRIFSMKEAMGRVLPFCLSRFGFK